MVHSTLARFLVLAAGLLVFTTVRSQSGNLSSWRSKTIAVNTAGQLVDSLTVVPASLAVYEVPSGNQLPNDYYRQEGRFLRWNVIPATDSIRVRYRILPFSLLAEGRLLDSTTLVKNDAGDLIGSYDPYVRGDIFDSDGRVDYRGSFTRGFSFGNRQDLVLNSAFNLQMRGELGNGVNVRAAITDESLPIQPEGNTQQLREFDRIFIELSKDRTVLTAGDYELRNPDGYFLRYFKKLEGATLRTESGALNPEEGGRWRQSASVAIARGQFVRRSLTPGEGNQGPYRLTGDGGQRFLIILSGTERIYLDGQLLRRGQDADYVIDYNLAELTFTTRKLITRDSRIVVEYEFADQRYLRTLLAADTRYEKGPWTAYANVLSQQDSRTATGDLRLTNEQRRLLSLAGDRDAGVLVPAIDTLEGRADQRATYVQRDTLISCGGSMLTDSYLLLSNSNDATLVTAAFTDFGPGGGPYEQLSADQANERAFRFVGYDPQSCEPLGRFRPEISVVAPRTDQLLTFGGSYERESTSIRMEGGRSFVDQNRFSELDATDDVGWAARLDGEHLLSLGRSDSSWRLAVEGHYEYREANFRPLNPYRSPDFFRDWNLSNRLGTVLPEARDEILAEGAISLLRPGWGRLTYFRGGFERGDNYRGDRQRGSLQIGRAGFDLNATFESLESETDTERGRLERPVLRLSKALSPTGNWVLSGEFLSEHSERRRLNADTLLPISFGFERYAVGLKGKVPDRYEIELMGRRRRDVLPDGGRTLVESTEADELLVEGSYEAGRNLRLGGNFTYRRLSVARSDLVAQQPGQTYLGRFDVTARALKNSFRSQTAYTLGSGQEPRVEFQYLFVGPGQGQYIWQDSLYNNDGRIQPNEMEIAPFADIADYVRVTVFTDDFIRTDNAGINQSFSWDPSRLWRDVTGVRKWLRKFQWQGSLTVDRKTRENDEVQLWNPLQLDVADSTLVALSAGTRNTVFYNRAHPKYDMQFSNRDLRRRRVLTTGYEATRLREYELQFRYRPNRQLSLIMGGSAGERSNDSEAFNNKDFLIRFLRLEPSLEWQPGEDFRIDADIVVGRERNELMAGNGEATDRREVKLEGNYRRWLRLEINYVNIDLEGQANSPVGFALLNGLQPGQNWLWNLNATRQLGRYLQLTLSYEGRQTGKAATVHVGRAQVTALF